MRKFIAGPTTRVLILIWVVAFFVVIVPGHRRGIVQLPSNAPIGATEVSRAYCPLCALLPSGSSQDRPPADAPGSCAICFLKANVDTPPPLVLPPSFDDRLDYLLLSPHRLAAVDLAPQHRLRGRAPPAA
ncbi:MAG: hypothetical protein AAF800_01945 [Planctomycetota bacterium]